MPTEPAIRDVPDAASSAAGAGEGLSRLIGRPLQERLREHKYRCAQALVFGLPVLGLQWFGQGLAGQDAEAQRWIGLFQALLAGWVLYTGATGMLVEGLLPGTRAHGGDLVAAVLAVGLYLWSIGAVLAVPVLGKPAYGPLLFHAVVLVIAGWTGWQWWRLSRLSRAGGSDGD